MIIFIEDSHSWKDFMQRKLWSILIPFDRTDESVKVLLPLWNKEKRVRLAETIPYFQSSISEFLSAEDMSEDDSFRFDPK